MHGQSGPILNNTPSPKGPTIIEERAYNFLKAVPPFQFLPEAQLQQVVSQVEIHYFPQDSHILGQNNPSSHYLYVIERGGVKTLLVTELAEQNVVDIAAEGELFGLLSSLESGPSPVEVVALTDTICYAIPQPVVQELLNTQPAFAQYLLRFSLEHYVDWSLNQIRRAEIGATQPYPLLFSGQAKDLAHKPLLTCWPETSIQEAAQMMSAGGVGSIVVTNSSGQAIGIVTDWDLRERVVAAGWDVMGHISQIMSTPLQTVESHTPIQQVVSLMMKQRVHHVVVCENNQPDGMLTTHDLVMLQGASTLSIAREIEHQTTLAGLRRAHEYGQQSIPMLLRQGVKAGQLGHMLADLNDRLVRRVIEWVAATLEPPPVAYCWLSLGSEGRQEQTFKTDQDNALIYATPPLEIADTCQQYFLTFGQQVVEALIEVGFPPCPGQFMANNPRWVQPLTGWETQFTTWVNSRDSEELVETLLFFDLRGISGDLTLVDQLQPFILALIDKNPRFLSRVARLSVRQTPPLGFLGRFTLEHNGEHQDTFDLKRRGTIPIVDWVRYQALSHNLRPTNTLQRLALLKAGGHVPADLADSLAQAYEFILGLRIGHEWQQLRNGQTPSLHLNPNQLSTLDRRLLREAFKIIGQAQALVK